MTSIGIAWEQHTSSWVPARVSYLGSAYKGKWQGKKTRNRVQQIDYECLLLSNFKNFAKIFEQGSSVRVQISFWGWDDVFIENKIAEVEGCDDPECPPEQLLELVEKYVDQEPRLRYVGVLWWAGEEMAIVWDAEREQRNAKRDAQIAAVNVAMMRASSPSFRGYPIKLDTGDWAVKIPGVALEKDRSVWCEVEAQSGKKWAKYHRVISDKSAPTLAVREG